MSKITRREFIKDASLAAGGLLAGSGAAALYSRNPVSTNVLKPNNRLTQTATNESVCTGCETCELVCSVFHDGAVGPNLRRIWLNKNEDSLTYQVLTCLQCDYPSCYFACPQRDKALCIEGGSGIRYINSNECTQGCKECVKACTLEPPRISFDPEQQIVRMCDMCRNRPAGPACIEFCPAQCLKMEER
ncbi:MAG: twin-arginine translocation signal domain-containing protein [Dehalococcoidales bacterium]|nr:twin-arginine translocation signal domain-containing protein [Dehalococcoidales bacterium]NLE90729.1 twin-arginine translocation signal domain-containing protein [Dehalococcoidales bacterium]